MKSTKTKLEILNLGQRDQAKQKKPLSTKFQQYIVDKAVNWALQSTNGKTRFSELKWDDEERALLNQIIDNPKSADLKLPIQDSKFKRFFKSIAENGLNTLDVEMFYRYRDRLPLRELQWEFRKEDFLFTKTKVTTKEVIPAGYYMLEVSIKTEKFSSQIEFNLQTVDQTKSKHQIFELQAKSNRICKRLIFLEQNSKLETSLASNVTDSEIYHLRLARLTKNFFMSRMFNKIGRQFDVKNEAKLSQEELKAIWGQYDSIFKKNRDFQTEYENYIQQVEIKNTPSRSQQLKNLQIWSAKNTNRPS